MDPAIVFSALTSAIAVLFGWVTKLQYDALKYRDRRIEKLEEELKATNDKVTQAVTTGNESTRQELAELRKTNAELVTALMAKGKPS